MPVYLIRLCLLNKGLLFCGVPQAEIVCFQHHEILTSVNYDVADTALLSCCMFIIIYCYTYIKNMLLFHLAVKAVTKQQHDR